MIAFAHIQKTAGVTLNWILRRSFGLRHCEVRPWRPFLPKDYYDTVYSAADHVRVQRLCPRLESISGHHVKPFSDLELVRPDVRYFTFLREPCARAASHYQYAVQRMGYQGSLEERLEDEHRHDLQTRHIAGSDDVDKAIRILEERCFFVGLIEKFDESLVLLQQRAARPRLDVRYRRENVAEDNDIARRVLEDPRSRELIERTNRADARLYAYVRDELFPRQVREFGAGLEAAIEDLRRPDGFRRNNLAALANRSMKFLVLEPLARHYRGREAGAAKAPSRQP